MIDRRTVLLLSSSALVLPWSKRALSQQAPALPTVGFLSMRSEADIVERVAVFRQALAEAGFNDGQNVRVEYRFGDGDRDRLFALAAELAELRPTVITTTSGILAMEAVRKATPDIPVLVMIGVDPVQAGIVRSMGQPGGNLSGVSLLVANLEPKKLELLAGLVPAGSAIAGLFNPSVGGAPIQIGEAEQAAKDLGLRMMVVRASTDAELDAALAAMRAAPIAGVIVGANAFLAVRKQRIVDAVNAKGVPGVYEWREYVEAGGLMSYGPRLSDGFRILGQYTGRILKGDRIGDLPIQQLSRFELVINAKTAKALGLAFPPAILAQVTEVIE